MKVDTIAVELPQQGMRSDPAVQSFHWDVVGCNNIAVVIIDNYFDSLSVQVVS